MKLATTLSRPVRPGRFPRSMQLDPVTTLLRRMEEGDSEAGEDLFALLYDELHKKARGIMGAQRAGHTLQPTAVVHEAWLKIAGKAHAATEDDPGWRDRAHFLGVATRAMRLVLVDHARARSAQKRPVESEREPLHDAIVGFEERAYDLVELGDALQRLEAVDPVLVKLVDLRFFGGLTIREAADVLHMSTASVERGWRTARAFLRAELLDATDT